MEEEIHTPIEWKSALDLEQCPTAPVMSVPHTIETTQHLGEHLLGCNIEKLVDISKDWASNFDS